MIRSILYTVIITILLIGTIVQAQDTDSTISGSNPDITGEWITQGGNVIDVELNGNAVTMYFPYFAKRMTASFNGEVLVYVTHYNDPRIEECYLDVPESERSICERFVQAGDARHRFTLSLSDDGLVLSGVKEINVLHCTWDTDSNGNTSNHRPTGYTWEYFSDYQWRRANCDFNALPSLTGNIIERFELLEIIFDRFGLRAEFNLGDFEVMDRIKFIYSQNYIDADNGEYVPNAEASEHLHLEPLDGSVYLDEVTGDYFIELYPYAMESYINLLSGLTILSHQLHALETLDSDLQRSTTEMELDAVNYAWNHRQALCTLDDEQFDHHIDFLSRALRFREMAED